MLRKMLLHLPLALVLGVTMTATPAVAHVPGEVQLMTGAAELEHTIRHGDGSWDRFNQLPAGPRGGHRNLASAIVNGELNVVYDIEAQIKPIFREVFLSIRHANGTWSKVYTPFGLSSGPHAVAAVNGDLHVVQRSLSGVLRHAIRHADGSWSPLSDVPVPQGSTGASAVATNGALEVLVINGDSLVTTTLLADGTWSPATPATFFSTRFQASTVDLARVGPDLHVVVNSTDGRLYHAIRRSDGRWTGWGDVGGETGVPGVVDSVAVTASGTTLHLAVTTVAGGLFHAIRFENGTWQRYGDVRAAAGGTPSHDVAIAGD